MGVLDCPATSSSIRPQSGVVTCRFSAKLQWKSLQLHRKVPACCLAASLVWLLVFTFQLSQNQRLETERLFPYSGLHWMEKAAGTSDMANFSSSVVVAPQLSDEARRIDKRDRTRSVSFFAALTTSHLQISRADHHYLQHLSNSYYSSYWHRKILLSYFHLLCLPVMHIIPPRALALAEPSPSWTRAHTAVRKQFFLHQPQIPWVSSRQPLLCLLNLPFQWVWLHHFNYCCVFTCYSLMFPALCLLQARIMLRADVLKQYGRWGLDTTVRILVVVASCKKPFWEADLGMWFDVVFLLVMIVIYTVCIISSKCHRNLRHKIIHILCETARILKQ